MNEDLILIEQLCIGHQIETRFIATLESYGLVEIITVENNRYLRHEQLAPLEKMIRLHFELQVNPEGLDVIANLLQQIEGLQRELTVANNRLRRFEETGA